MVDETRPVDKVGTNTAPSETPTTPEVQSGESGWVDPDATLLMRVPSGEVAVLDEVEDQRPDVSGAHPKRAHLDAPESSPDAPPVLAVDPEIRAGLDALFGDVPAKLSRLSALLARKGYTAEEIQELMTTALQVAPERPQVGLAILLELVAQPGGIVAKSESSDGPDRLESLVVRGGALAAALPELDAGALARLVAHSAPGLQLMSAPPPLLAENVRALHADDQRPGAEWTAELEVLLLVHAPGLGGTAAQRLALETALADARFITDELFASDQLARRQRGLISGALATLIADGASVTDVRRLAQRARATAGEATPTLLVLALMQTRPMTPSQTGKDDREPEPWLQRVEAVVEKAETRLDQLEQDLPAASVPDRAVLITTMGEQLLSGSEQLYAALVQILMRMGPHLRPGRLQRLRERIRRASRRVGNARTASTEEWLLAVEAFGPLTSL